MKVNPAKLNYVKCIHPMLGCWKDEVFVSTIAVFVLSSSRLQKGMCNCSDVNFSRIFDLTYCAEE